MMKTLSRQVLLLGCMLFIVPLCAHLRPGLATHLQQAKVPVAVGSILHKDLKLQRDLEAVMALLKGYPGIRAHFVAVHQPLFAGKPVATYRDRVRAFSHRLSLQAVPSELKMKIHQFNIDAATALRSSSLLRTILIGTGTAAAVVAAALAGWYWWPKKENRPKAPEAVASPEVPTVEPEVQDSVVPDSLPTQVDQPATPESDAPTESEDESAEESEQPEPEDENGPVVIPNSLPTQMDQEPVTPDPVTPSIVPKSPITITSQSIVRKKREPSFFKYGRGGVGAFAQADRALVAKLSSDLGKKLGHEVVPRDFLAALLLYETGNLSADSFKRTMLTVPRKTNPAVYALKITFEFNKNLPEKDQKQYRFDVPGLTQFHYVSGRKNPAIARVLGSVIGHLVVAQEHDVSLKFLLENFRQKAAGSGDKSMLTTLAGSALDDGLVGYYSLSDMQRLVLVRVLQDKYKVGSQIETPSPRRSVLRKDGAQPSPPKRVQFKDSGITPRRLVFNPELSPNKLRSPQ